MLPIRDIYYKIISAEEPRLDVDHSHPSSPAVKKTGIILFFLWRFGPYSGHGLPLRGFAITLLWTSDQPDAQISTRQHTTLTRDRYPCPRWDSNPQSQQAMGRRPTPQTAPPPGSAELYLYSPCGVDRDLRFLCILYFAYIIYILIARYYNRLLLIF